MRGTSLPQFRDLRDMGSLTASTEVKNLLTVSASSIYVTSSLLVYQREYSLFGLSLLTDASIKPLLLSHPFPSSVPAAAHLSLSPPYTSEPHPCTLPWSPVPASTGCAFLSYSSAGGAGLAMTVSFLPHFIYGRDKCINKEIVCRRTNTF